MKVFLMIMAIMFAVMSLAFFIVSVGQGTYINIQATVSFAACAVISAVNLVGMLIVSRLNRIWAALPSTKSPASGEDEFSTDALSLQGMTAGISGESKSDTRGLFYVRKSWDDPDSQVAMVTRLSFARQMAESRPGYHVYGEDGQEIPPEPTEVNV